MVSAREERSVEEERGGEKNDFEQQVEESLDTNVEDRRIGAEGTGTRRTLANYDRT